MGHWRSHKVLPLRLEYLGRTMLTLPCEMTLPSWIISIIYAQRMPNVESSSHLKSIPWQIITHLSTQTDSPTIITKKPCMLSTYYYLNMCAGWQRQLYHNMIHSTTLCHRCLHIQRYMCKSGNHHRRSRWHCQPMGHWRSHKELLLKSEYLGRTILTPLILMPWLPGSPGDQQ